jgi:hypothetical protein
MIFLEEMYNVSLKLFLLCFLYSCHLELVDDHLHFLLIESDFVEMSIVTFVAHTLVFLIGKGQYLFAAILRDFIEVVFSIALGIEIDLSELLH